MREQIQMYLGPLKYTSDPSACGTEKGMKALFNAIRLFPWMPS